MASSDDSHEKENVLTSSTGNAVYVLPEVSPFMNDPTFMYEDFAKRGQVSEMHTFRIQVRILIHVIIDLAQRVVLIRVVVVLKNN